MAAVGEVGLSAGTIRYEDVGRGPVLLFVHGLLVNGLLWRNGRLDTRSDGGRYKMARWRG